MILRVSSFQIPSFGSTVKFFRWKRTYHDRYGGKSINYHANPGPLVLEQVVAYWNPIKKQEQDENGMNPQNCWNKANYLQEEERFSLLHGVALKNLHGYLYHLLSMFYRKTLVGVCLSWVRDLISIMHPCQTAYETW